MDPAARRLILAGYGAPLVILALAVVTLPRDAGDLGGNAWFALALLASAAISGVLVSVGCLVGFSTLVRQRGRVPWFDYGLLAAGVALLVALGFLLLT
jgi:hypothetical protein